jgi:acyl dehydratase
MSAVTVNRYLEDVVVGERYKVGPVEVAEAECLAFSRAYDPQPMHLDEEAARPRFGGIIASGWFTIALVMRMFVEAKLLGDSEVLGMGVEQLRWRQPVRPGDTLEIEIEAASVKPSQSNPRFGVVTFGVTTRNQRGEVVMTHSPSCWVPRRP